MSDECPYCRAHEKYTDRIEDDLTAARQRIAELERALVAIRAALASPLGSGAPAPVPTVCAKDEK
jgi:hypothetical protein